ncbi:Rpn family recombination-promoting nuclease/putative transposase [Desulfobotulus mexicanus]|uniref:Rpn family recombination-promoting nuclease/putative transposase n=1 Tax=Desulfobotulus mexicanus TaxID=2586642 RepID=A0A5Q4VEI6_9BACT|nr:Rpn family recombination-promoting nuclease/putative transposase [Desulfobotulus mexicanus]TYT76109.1 Rpn family recombination-promoting nuclease/putative transposase [Desulfobotulus mexicanus]
MGNHDIFFKKILDVEGHAEELVRSSLPSAILEGLDLSTLKEEKGSFLGEELSEYFSDLLYTCQFKGTLIRIALLFEHKSYVDNDLPFQIHLYTGGFWERCRKQKIERTPIIPIVIYHGERKWQPGLLSDCFKDLPPMIKPFIPDSEYIFVDLSSWQDEDIKNKLFAMVSMKFCMLIFKNVFDPDKLKDNIKEYFELASSLFEDEDGLKIIKNVIEYIFKATDLQPEYVAETIGSVSLKGKELAMTTAERLINEGRNEGVYSEKYQTIMRFSELNIKPEDIAHGVGLTPEKVRAVIAAGDKGLDLLIGEDTTKH